jgi:pimeloyl-ACP methyl ester carboxylesterase
MPRPVYRQRWAWVGGMRAPPRETIADVESVDFALSGLADRGLLTTRQLADFQDETGLADLAWRVSWHRSALVEAKGDYRSLLRRTQGFVIFMHGWSASGQMWEHLPELTCAANPRLVALTPDLNGFGNTPFLAEVPTVEQCDPSAVMHAVTYWVEILGLRSGVRAQRRRKVITFVGHSMGGAALFYLRERSWDENEFARCAVAPALLVTDELREGFYRALGVGSWQNKPIDELKSSLTPKVVERMLGAVSEMTRDEHLRLFETTPRGTLAQTFYAMGTRPEELKERHWRHFRVILAHDDRMINVTMILDLLDHLGLGPPQVQVVSGDHFLFSASDQSRFHLRNREIVLGEILYLHEVCRERQRVQLID